MKVERYQPKKRSNLPYIACGCITLIIGLAGTTAITGILLFPMLSGLIAQAAGFEDLGDAESVFVENSAPAPQLSNPQAVNNDITIVVQGFGQQTISSNNPAYDVQVGDENGVEALQITSDETGLLTLCQQYSDICTSSGAQARNVRFDLRPNGVILYGDYYIPQINSYQSAGLVMQVQGARLAVAGIELNGRIYGNPPEQFANTINDLENQATSLLSQLLINSGGDSYILRDIYVDDSTIVLTMR